ncbi:hypothetical protein FRC00_002327 [Tulasnella sp. 408]|nr:hypothetical protein FRC00_002327 [Tulasnella sp. 408]
MARTELYAYMKLGPHSNIVRAMENFYDPDAQLYRIILETAITDLHTLLLRLRSEGQADLATMAPIWIDQLTSGFQHVHQCGMAHRDVKPENVLVFVPEPGRIVLKLTDFGLARLPKQPVLIGCSAGTPGWMAPASFAYHNDDRLSDCYGVGRLLYAILTSRAWPNEPTKRGRSCGCPSACPNACTEREAAFQDVENAKAGKHCVGFLRKLLVGSPDHCMNAQEMRQHQYLKPASSGFLQQVVKSVEWRLYRRLIQMCTAA